MLRLTMCAACLLCAHAARQILQTLTHTLTVRSKLIVTQAQSRVDGATMDVERTLFCLDFTQLDISISHLRTQAIDLMGNRYVDFLVECLPSTEIRCGVHSLTRARARARFSPTMVTGSESPVFSSLVTFAWRVSMVSAICICPPKDPCTRQHGMLCAWCARPRPTCSHAPWLS